MRGITLAALPWSPAAEVTDTGTVSAAGRAAFADSSGEGSSRGQKAFSVGQSFQFQSSFSKMSEV